MAAAAALIATACGRSERAADTTATRMDTSGGNVATPATDTMSKPATRGGWTDASILAYLRAEDRDEVRVNELAAKKATNPALKAFARQMASDHRASMGEGKALAAKLHVTFDTTKDESRDVMNRSKDEVKDLTDKKAGPDWDKDYLKMQIDEHQKVLDKLQDAAKNATDPELRSALEKVTGKVQEHLTKAQDILNNKLKS